MVDLTLEQPGDHHYVRSVSDQGIRIGESSYRHALIVTPTELIDDWSPQHMDELQADDLDVLIALQPELVLLGTGPKQVFLAPKDMYRFYERGIGIEVMSTEAACRTFNVLVTEGRKVAAGLLPITAHD
jgi:uncharacterized protein